MITAVRSADIQTKFRDICQRVLSGDVIIVARPANKNVVILDEEHYQALAAQNNAKLDMKLDKAWGDFAAGRGQRVTIEGLR